MADELMKVEYEANGELVKLSPSIIRKYLVSGGGNVTDQEVMMFLTLCKHQHLNPFLKEAYLIKYGSNDPATIVMGKDVFTKRAQSIPEYEGKQAGITVLSGDGKIIEREGTLMLPGEQLLGGWAKVFIKGHQAPEYASVSLEEYIGRKKNGEVNSNWQKRPATMIRKVAVVQALREAFPDRLQGMYAQEEMTDVSGMNLEAGHDVKEAVKADIEEHANSVQFEEAEVIEVQAEMEISPYDDDLPEFMREAQ